MEVSKNTLKALNSLYQSIRYDLPEDTDNMEAIECCLDAHRLSMNGYTEAHEEIMNLVETVGYLETLYCISEKINLI